MGNEKEPYLGLAILRTANQLTFRSICQTDNGAKYFEFRDLNQRRSILVCECVDEKSDVGVRDRYGIIRYCISGAFDKNKQLDVYITSDSPIGLVKNGVIYDAKMRPMFKIYFGSEEWSCPSGRIMIYNIFDNKMVGEIIPKPNEFSIDLVPSMPVHCKALILAISVQIAFSRFGYMQHKLPHLEGEMMYETEEQGKALNTSSTMKPAKEAIHDIKVPSPYNSVRMLDIVSDLYVTASGRNSLGLEYYEVRTHDNNILLAFEKASGTAPQLVAKDHHGEMKFAIMGELSAQMNEVRTANGDILGIIQPTSLQDENGKARLYYKLFKDSAGSPVFNIFRPDSSNTVATVSHNGTFVTLSVVAQIDGQLKALILALCIKLAIEVYQIHSDAMRNMNYMYRNYTDSMYKPKSIFTNLEVGAVGKHSLGPLCNIEEVRVRGAGYNSRGVHFYEIIDVVDDKIKMTIECLPNEGQSQIKDRHGNIHIQISGLWLGATDMFVRLGNGFLLGIIREHILLDREEKCVLVAKPESGWEADNAKRPFLIYADDTQEVKAKVIPEVSTMLIKMDAQLELSSKAKIFAFAMRLFVKVYRFHKIPIPLVDYHYVKSIPLQPRKDKIYRFDNMLKALSTAVTADAKGQTEKKKSAKSDDNKSMLVQVIIDKENADKTGDLHSPVNVVAHPGKALVSQPISLEPSPRADPFPTLQLFNPVVNICIRPIGEDKNGIKYFKIIDLDRNRSFLTCECASPSQDMCFKQRYGLHQFYMKGGFLQQEPTQLYINPGVIVGDIEGAVISNHRKKPIFHTSKPITICGPPIFKVLHIQSKQLMGRVCSMNSEVIININSVCTPQQKALIMAFALHKGFSELGLAKLANQRVNYQYVIRKSQSSAGRNRDSFALKQRKNKTSQPRDAPAATAKPQTSEPTKTILDDPLAGITVEKLTAIPCEQPTATPCDQPIALQVDQPIVIPCEQQTAIPDKPQTAVPDKLIGMEPTRYRASVSSVNGVKVPEANKMEKSNIDGEPSAKKLSSNAAPEAEKKNGVVVTSISDGIDENYCCDSHIVSGREMEPINVMKHDAARRISVQSAAAMGDVEQTENAGSCSGDKAATATSVEPSIAAGSKAQNGEGLQYGKSRNSALEEIQDTITVHHPSAPSNQQSRKTSSNKPSIRQRASNASKESGDRL